MVLLNTVVHSSPKVLRPEAIELFSSKGLRRNFLAWGSRTFDGIWIRRYEGQLARFVVRDDEASSSLLRALAAQSFDIRPAFLQLNRHLRSEMGKRAQNIED